MSTVLSSLNAALHAALATDERVLLLGEDIVDPYGGAFKVTRGLSTDFPGRVLVSPISEAALVGVAAGMALRGLRPVVEIMFGDFITLAADSLINTAAKFGWMYHRQVQIPLVVRTPMGGRRGYGPTHSQTLEKHFLGIPGLGVVAPCNLPDGAGEILFHTITQGDTPVLFIENKVQYLLPVLDGAALVDFDLKVDTHPGLPAYTLTIRAAPAPVCTLASYGYMSEIARQAQYRLAYESEIFTELVVLTQLAPFSLEAVIASSGRTGRLLTVEEGALSLGWGSEVLAQAVEVLGTGLRSARRLAGRDLPVPAAPALEQKVLPDVEDIIQAVKRMV